MMTTYLPGAELLKLWLADRGLATHRFALSIGYDPSELHKILTGKRKSASVALAVAIEDATKGEVPVRAWVPRRIEEERRA